MPDVAAYEMDASGHARALHPRTCARQHRLGSIDADQRDARATKRQRNASRPASELEHRTAGVNRQIAPEGHVTPAERARVLPVVERRVLVPAFVSFSHRHAPKRGRRSLLTNHRDTEDTENASARSCVASGPALRAALWPT